MLNVANVREMQIKTLTIRDHLIPFRMAIINEYKQ